MSSPRGWGALAIGALFAAACAGSPEAPPSAPVAAMPKDAQHEGLTTPHGDHSPHHGGLVLMNGELHYEVVVDPGGSHRIWFSNAVREDPPASLASNVRMIVRRKGETPEAVALAIDEAGESWVGRGRAVAGDVMVMITYEVRGVPHEVDIPFTLRGTR